MCMENKDARSLSNEAQYELRKRMISFINKGHTIRQAMDTFEVSQSYVQKVKRLFKQGGMPGLKLGKRGRKIEFKLNLRDQIEVSKLIRNHMPEQLKLPFGLWTRRSVSKLIESRYGVKVSRWTVGRYLRSMGFSPQKPAKRAYEQNPERVKAWLKEEYPGIVREAKHQQAKILWGDQMGLRSDDQVGRTYAPKGQTPIVKKTGNRFRINMISAISNRGDLKFMIINGTFNWIVFIDFLGRMLKGETNKIFLIIDCHPVHKSKKVTQWVASRSHRIELFFLPPYSPELNPDEYLNQDIKTNTVRSKPPRDKNELTSTVTDFVVNKKKSKKAVKQYFQNEFIKYAAA